MSEHTHTTAATTTTTAFRPVTNDWFSSRICFICKQSNSEIYNYFAPYKHNLFLEHRLSLSSRLYSYRITSKSLITVFAGPSRLKLVRKSCHYIAWGMLTLINRRYPCNSTIQTHTIAARNQRYGVSGNTFMLFLWEWYVRAQRALSTYR